MIKVIFDKIEGEIRLPIKTWADDIEEGAMEQAVNLVRLPFAFKHIAIMPDCHQGYGMPIGGILATKDYIIPNAVGVDIGCGMNAIKTNLQFIETISLKRVLGEIRKVIPVGFEHNKESNHDAMPEGEIKIHTIIYKEFDNATKQIGTLGGGNHFIEIQQDTNKFIWIMIHSGSRNLGYKVAKYYNDVAKGLNQKWLSAVPVKWDLAFLPAYSDEGQNYLNEMDYCVRFAKVNRELMMSKIIDIFYNELGVNKLEIEIDIAHNYARMENHFENNVWIHRKGATSARAGEIGIIPGSQGTKSYIVKGLGNPESFTSCSHGAGRVMSRSKAIKELDLEKEIEMLSKKGIIHSIRHQKDLDESPSAYKNIETVMANQKDLVEIVEELTPLAVIKG